jgi:hypothetical protein
MKPLRRLYHNGMSYFPVYVHNKIDVKLKHLDYRSGRMIGRWLYWKISARLPAHGIGDLQ